MKNNKHTEKFKAKQILAVMLTIAVAAPSFVYGADSVDITDDSNAVSYTENRIEDVMPEGNSAESTAAVKDLRWDFVTDEEGFLPENAANTTIRVNGNDLRVTGTNPKIQIGGLSINPNKQKYLYIRALNNSNCWQGQIYLLKNGFSYIYKIDYKAYNNQNKDKYMYYKISLDGGVVQAGGTMQEDYDTLRLDFTSVGTGNIDIDYIVLSSEESSNDSNFVNPNDFVTKIGIGETLVDCTGADKPQYYEANVYEDAYKTLTKEDISAAIKEGTGATVSDITIKDVKDRKIVDVTATSGGSAQTVRVVCKAVVRPVFLTVDTCDINRKTISFSGSLADDGGKPLSTPITAVAYKSGTTVDKTSIKFIKNIIPAADGKFSCAFNVNDSETTAEKYEMTVVFDVMGATTPQKRTLTYLNNKYASENIEQLKESSDDIFEFMSTGDNKIVYERLGVWVDLYESQTNEVKNEINQAINPYKNDLTEENAAEIANASIIAKLTGKLSAENIAELIEKYDKDSNKVEIAKSETTTKSYSEFELKSRNNIAAKLKENYILSDYKKFKTALRETMLIEEISLVSYMKLKELLLSNTDILDDDLDELSALTDETILDTAMGAVSTTAKKSGYTSAEALVSDVKKEIKEAKGSNGGSVSKPKPSGGNSGGSIGVSGSPAASDKTEEVVPSTDKFVDMDGFGWAKTAVEYLSDKKIINGVGGNKFDPAATVKREEFVKMICNGFNIIGSGADVNYDDVVKGEWYYPYVATATEYEIINGISDREFGTGEDIKREDMAVIIYRTLKSLNKIGDETANMTFDDVDDISDYAEEAVAVLSSAGIINGTEDNRFEPEKSASRAEAAVMIYRCMEMLK